MLRCSSASRNNLRLPSFPTRRSSDLPAARGGWCPRYGQCRRPDGVFGRQRARYRRRSEEHTSELQSRLDLVCRLLLQKQNEAKEGEQYADRRAGRGRMLTLLSAALIV